jgi:hypothetical protein
LAGRPIELAATGEDQSSGKLAEDPRFSDFPRHLARLMAFAQIDLMKTLDSLAHRSIGNLEDRVLYFRFRQPQRAISEIS